MVMKTASTKIQFSLKVTGQEWKSIAAMISEVIGYMGFVYFTSVMDLYSRKIIAWTLSRTMEVKYNAEKLFEKILSV